MYYSIIIAILLANVDLRFLLAQLYVDSLVYKTTPKAIRLALEELEIKAVGSNDDNISKTLDRAYVQAMERMEAQAPEHRKLASQVLSWITCAKRRLTSSELQHAIAVEVNKRELDRENITDIELIVSVCAGLVIINEESDILRLVHYTTQEYFERNWERWFPNSHTDITKTCVTYLSFQQFEAGFSPTYEAFQERLQSNVLYDYCARNWGYHACISSIEGEQLVLDLLKSMTKVSACSQAMRYQKDMYMYGSETRMTGVHLAAYFGLWKSMSGLLERLYDVHVEDRWADTAVMGCWEWP
jgi:GPI inositol-deacylase-like protein